MDKATKTPRPKRDRTNGAARQSEIKSRERKARAEIFAASALRVTGSHRSFVGAGVPARDRWWTAPGAIEAEDLPRFRLMAAAIERDLCPVGAIEEATVDEIILALWRGHQAALASLTLGRALRWADAETIVRTIRAESVAQQRLTVAELELATAVTRLLERLEALQCGRVRRLQHRKPPPG